MGQFPGVGEDSGVLVLSTVQFAQTATEAQRDRALIETNGYVNCANAANTASENAIIGQNGGQAKFGPQQTLDAARIGLDPRESSVSEQQEILTIGPATSVADALNAFIVVGRTELTLAVSSIGRGPPSKSLLLTAARAMIGRAQALGPAPSRGKSASATTTARPPVGVPPPPAIDCPLLTFTTSAGASVTAFSIKLGQDWEEELADTSAGWEVSSVHGLDLGAVASLGGHLHLGSGGSAKIGWDLELAASLGYQHGLTALYPSREAAVGAYLELGAYQLEHSVPGGEFFFGGLPADVKSALISQYDDGGVIADAQGSFGLVGGDTSLSMFAGQDTDPRTGALTYEFTLKPGVSLPGLAANAVVELKVRDNAQHQATTLEIDTQGLISSGFTFSTAGLLEQLAPRTSGSASDYGASADVTDTRIVVDLRSRATQAAGHRFMASLQRGNLAGVVSAWSDLTKQATIYSFIMKVQSDNTGVDVSGGEGLTFGGGAGVDAERGRLIQAAFQSPGSAGLRLWNACLALAVRANYESPVSNG